MPIFNQLDTKESSFSKSFDAYLLERNKVSGEVSQLVSEIILKIRSKGDNALKDLTKEFDGFDTDVFKISSKEINQIVRSCDKDIFKSLEYSFEKIINYQSRCFASLNLEDTDNEITRKFRVIESVGIYVPGGKASYPSTVLMGAAPAIACGVSDISITSPAQNGILNTLTIAAAKVAGIETIYRIGGAQAIAALAIGTDQISKVDKIIGPGNIFVAEAKKQVYGVVGIDMVAGPSEILIVCDGTTNPDWVALDLFSQAEHDESAQSILLTTDKEFLNQVYSSIEKLLPIMERKSVIEKSLKNRGALILVDNLTKACELANLIAPEHLELSVENSRSWAKLITNAGSLFLGRYSSESLGDYCAGPNHVLPTSGSARFSSGLSVYDFKKRMSVISVSEKGAKALGRVASTLANGEKLSAHALAAEYRMKNESFGED